MKELRRKIDRFMYNNSSKGIPNLMLIICVGTLLSFFVMLADKSGIFYTFMRFDRGLILHGQVSAPEQRYLAVPAAVCLLRDRTDGRAGLGYAEV